MNEKDEFYLKNILEMILDIKKFLTGLDKAGFLESDLHQNAVMKKLENIGEATKHVSDNLKVKNPDIEWRKISGMRDVLIHDYFGTDLEEVWRTVTDDLLIYKKQVKKLLN